MDKYKYIFHFVNGASLDFTTTTDIDFHKISNTAIAFPEIYINMANVNTIRKIVLEGVAE